MGRERLFPETALAVGYFDAIGLSSALGVAKPQPEAYQRVAAMLGVRIDAERVAAMEVPYTGVVYLGATPHEALC